MDVGITWNKNSYYKAKVKHYKEEKETVYPIIIGKDCTMHEESRKVLNSLGISDQQIFMEVGLLLNRYYRACRSEIDDMLDRKYKEMCEPEKE